MVVASKPCTKKLIVHDIIIYVWYCCLVDSKIRMKWCELWKYKWNEYVTIALESQFKHLQSSPKKGFGGFNCDGHIFISFVFPQFTSFRSVFHSFHRLMNSINRPASSVWVFIAQLVEHCSANAEATGFESCWSPEILFFGLLCNCL